MLHTSRQAAINAGEKRYFTGKPCKHGHVTYRCVMNGCMECARIKSLKNANEKRSKMTEEDLLAFNEKRRAFWNNNSKRLNDERRERYAENKDEINEARREWNAGNREKVRRLLRESYERNAHKHKARAMYYHEKRALRIPSWSETDEILKFYENCPDGFEVDHVIPLLGELVSGLHVIQNLQYLPRAVNRAKRNSFEVA